MLEVDIQIKQLLSDRIKALETHFAADIGFFYGPIYPALERRFREFIEKLKQDGTAQKDKLVMLLNTPGAAQKLSKN